MDLILNQHTLKPTKHRLSFAALMSRPKNVSSCEAIEIFSASHDLPTFNLRRFDTTTSITSAQSTRSSA